MLVADEVLAVRAVAELVEPGPVEDVDRQRLAVRVGPRFDEVPPVRGHVDDVAGRRVAHGPPGLGEVREAREVRGRHVDRRVDGLRVRRHVAVDGRRVADQRPVGAVGVVGLPERLVLAEERPLGRVEEAEPLAAPHHRHEVLVAVEVERAHRAAVAEPEQARLGHQKVGEGQVAGEDGAEVRAHLRGGRRPQAPGHRRHGEVLDV